MKKKICVVGGGTAGWIAASYIKKSYNDLVDVTIVYDHSEPVIGVGESTTPAILDFLHTVGLSYNDLIKNIGSTLKVGIKFTDWNGDGKRYYHNFSSLRTPHPTISDINLIAAHELINGLDTGGETYSSYASDNFLIPVDNNKECMANVALHIDGVAFSEYLSSKFSNLVSVIDDKVVDIEIKNNKIDYVTCDKIGKIYADIFIDATGLKSVLMNKLKNNFVNKSQYLHMDSAFTATIPNTQNIPPYTEAIATKDGWIWKIPLQTRYGSGYVYSSKFTKDEDARQEYIKHIKEVHGIENPEVSNMPIKFTPGYWEEQWTGNCVAVGLASGFVEPLEATNIHMIITQSRLFCGCWDANETEWSRTVYNKLTSNMYEQTFDFIRFHYHTKREDSPLWIECKNNKPQWLINLSEKFKKGMITSFDVYYNWDRILGNNIFGLAAWTRVGLGLEMFNTIAVKHWLESRGAVEGAAEMFDLMEQEKSKGTFIKHDTFLKLVKE